MYTKKKKINIYFNDDGWTILSSTIFMYFYAELIASNNLVF